MDAVVFRTGISQSIYPLNKSKFKDAAEFGKSLLGACMARRFVTLLLLLLMVFADFWMILFVVADFSPFVSAETCGCLSRRKDTTYIT